MQSLQINFTDTTPQLNITEFRLECSNITNKRKLNNNIFGKENWVTYSNIQTIYQMKLSYILFELTNPGYNKNKLTTYFDQNKIASIKHILNYNDFSTYPYPVFDWNWDTGNYINATITFSNIETINGGADFKSHKADGDGQLIIITFQANILTKPAFT